MAFSERVKRLARKKSHFRCCICHKEFVEVHHIVPQSEGGKDTLENAAPLCAGCHDLYGGNPEKRKRIREMRDRWWELIEEMERYAVETANIDELVFVEDTEYKEKLKAKPGAIYHIVRENEGFEKTAHMLYELIKWFQDNYPGKERVLILDIEGHINDEGGFDDEMLELQRYFVMRFLSQFLSEVRMPLISYKTRQQSNDIPPELIICENEEEAEEIKSKYGGDSQFYGFNQD